MFAAGLASNPQQQYMMQMQMQQMMAANMAQAAPASLDDEKLNVFRRNWEYYSRHPKEMEKLRGEFK